MKKVKYPFALLNLSSLLLILLLLVFSGSTYAQEEVAVDLGGDPVVGKQLFNSNCAACHTLDKKAVGPALRDVAQRYEKEWLYKWIKSSSAMIASGDSRAIKIFEEYNKSPMQDFPALTNTDIDNIIAYTSQEKIPPPPPPDGKTTTASSGGFSNELVLGILAVVLAMLVIMLFLVNNVLRKIAEANGVVY